jgi:HSP20 family protein
MKKKKRHPLWFESLEPLEGLGRIDEEVHRMMREIGKIPFQMPKMRLEFARTIPIDIAESDGELILRAELPGFDKDEIKLKVTGTAVDISAEKKKISVEKGKTFYRQERLYGSARRIMTLPAEVKTEGVKAKFENGILEIIMQKKEASKKKEEKEVKVE